MVALAGHLGGWSPSARRDSVVHTHQEEDSTVRPPEEQDAAEAEVPAETAPEAPADGSTQDPEPPEADEVRSITANHNEVLLRR